MNLILSIIVVAAVLWAFGVSWDANG